DIASLMEKGSSSPSSTHSVVKWSQICHCSARKFRKIVGWLTEKSLIISETVNDRLRIVAPKLVKYRDEYSKKAGQDQDSRAEKEQEEKTDQKEIESKTDTVSTRAANSASVSEAAEQPALTAE